MTNKDTRERVELETQVEEQPSERNDASSPVMERVYEKDTGSIIAIAGHPIHAMLVHFPIAFVFAGLGADVAYWFTGDEFWRSVALWVIGGAFVTGVIASIAGTAELLLVPGIRIRVASWNHAIAAMALIAVIGTNWGLRLVNPEATLPDGLALSVLSAIAAGFAGYHGGKLIFHHGIGIMVSPNQ